MSTDTDTPAGEVEPGRAYTVPELARLANESAGYLWRLTRERRLAVVRMPGKRQRIRGRDWLDFVAASVVPAVRPDPDPEPEAESKPEPRPAAEAPRRERAPRRPVAERRDGWRGRVGI